MTTRRSKKLIDAIMEADEILRGVRKPSREFRVDATSIKALRAIRNDPEAVLSALVG